MDDISKTATAIAEEHNLPAPIVLGIIDVESGGHLYAQRFEPHYRWLFDLDTGKPFRRLSANAASQSQSPIDFSHYKDTSADTEWIGQKTSWGPMQIMGAVARERGFQEPFFSALCSTKGIIFGCWQLQWLRKRYPDEDWPGIVSAYNQGSPRRDAQDVFVNQVYVHTVMDAAAQWDE